MVRLVKPTLLFPASFKHVETRVEPTDASGVRRISMDYMAKTGSGITTGSNAYGWLKEDGCSVILAGIEAFKFDFR